MHAENNPRDRDAYRQKEKWTFERGIKVAHHQRYRKSCHGVARRKRKLIRRQDFRPAVRLQLTRPRTLTQFFQRFKDENTEGRRACRSANRGKLLRPPIDQQHDSEPVPKPAISHSSSQDHPQTHPPRSSPAIHPPHHTEIAPFDESPEGACNSHSVSPSSPSSPRS